MQDKNYDPRGLLSSITTRDNASAVLRNFIYGLNSLGQRTTITREDSAVLAIGYDARRQVISGQKTTAGTSFPAYDFRYAFDEMGNRKSAGSTAQPTATTYATNPLNQYTAVTQASLSLNPTVDLNGSTLNDGRTVSTWDERNQRRSVTQTSTGEQLFCKFDAVGRRTEEQELSATNSELRKTRYLYDGWNCVAEFAVTPVTAALVRKKTHTWGLDLSQTPQGAGGVGGLLATVDETATKAIYTAAYDGNGNVAALYTNSFSPAASYEYDPFGKTLSASGAYAVENKYRFSTKPQDRIGGLYYYGYRYYEPVTGRWPSRDPIEEKGGVNLFGFVGNDGVNRLDDLGLNQLYFEIITRIERTHGWTVPDAALGEKTRQWVTVETDTGKIVSRGNNTALTFGVVPALSGYFERSWKDEAQCKVFVKMSGYGQNLANPFLEAINWAFTFEIDLKNNTVVLKGEHDGFPSFEVSYRGKTYIFKEISPDRLGGDTEIKIP